MRATTTRQAVDAMHQFERYDNSRGETNNRARTATGFIRQVADAIRNTYNRVVDTVGGAFKRVFGANEPPAPVAPEQQPPEQQPLGLRINRISGDPEAPHATHRQAYAQYGVPVRGHEHRPPAHTTPMKRPSVAAPAPHPVPHPAPVITIRRQHDDHTPKPRHNA